MPEENAGPGRGKVEETGAPEADVFAGNNGCDGYDGYDGYDAEFVKRYNVRTDLALEAHQVVLGRDGINEIPGVEVQSEKTAVAEITRMHVRTAQGSQAMGKMIGYYVTISSESLRNRNKDEQEQLAQTLAQELTAYFQHLGLGENASALVVGLGNWNATPDALGPKVVGELMVTRHLWEMSPPELRGGLRPVAAIAPGVLGLTGIETGEIVLGIVEKIGPDVVICVDALASRSSDRVCSTIQIADTGIHPGSGVGNKRLAITSQTLGRPVVAIGVPTVVHAMTIVGDAMELLAQEMGYKPRLGLTPPQAVQSPPILDPNRIRVMNGNPVEAGADGQGRQDIPRNDAFGLPLDADQRRYMLQHLLQPYMGSMIVTPREIDALIGDVAEVLAGGLNAALHPKLDLTEILKYLG